MKQRIKIILLYLVFWYLVSVIARIAFLVVYWQEAAALPFAALIGTFRYGFRLDISLAAYISLIPAIVLSASSVIKARIEKAVCYTITAIAALVVSATVIADLFLYRYWGYRIDATPLFYMKNLKAATASVSLLTVISGVLISLTVAGLLFAVSNRLFRFEFSKLKRDPKSLLLLAIMPALLFVVMRGGVGVSSLNTASAYFSQNQFANHAAINPVWNAGTSVTEGNDLAKEYNFYSEDECRRLLNAMETSGGQVTNLLRTSRPNIIVIITESLTAKALEATGGHAGIMPRLDALVHEGVLFDSVYATSDRTDKGLAAVLAGYPSLPGSSPLKFPKLTEKLNYMPRRLKDAGYNCRFFYGGDLNFANYNAFIVQSGFQKIVTGNDFPSEKNATKWGVYDHDLFDRIIADTPDSDSGFFTGCLTLTSHEPFTIPEKPLFKANDDESKFLSSLHYTDGAIGKFIDAAKTKKWWGNTLVIILGDHGSVYPGKSGPGSLNKYHIPMLWLGGALRVTDTVISKVTSQTDLASTLLGQLGLPAKGFSFSKNVLDSGTTPYAFFTFNEAFGLYINGDLLVYNVVTNQYSEKSIARTELSQKQGKAYLQAVFSDSHSKNR